MSRICFIDLDRVVAENSEREVLAMEFANSRFVPEKGIIPSIVYRDAWQKIFYSERAFYKPEWVQLDALIEGAEQALADLEWDHQYRIVYLTSRPESLRDVTIEWLQYQNIYFEAKMRVSTPRQLVMKSPAFTQAPPNHTYTRIWKAGIVQTLASLYGASDLMVIDDNQDILDEIGKWITTPQYRGFTSLKEAVEAIREEREG